MPARRPIRTAKSPPGSGCGGLDAARHPADMPKDVGSRTILVKKVRNTEDVELQQVQQFQQPCACQKSPPGVELCWYRPWRLHELCHPSRARNENPRPRGG